MNSLVLQLVSGPMSCLLLNNLCKCMWFDNHNICYRSWAGSFLENESPWATERRSVLSLVHANALFGHSPRAPGILVSWTLLFLFINSSLPLFLFRSDSIQYSPKFCSINCVFTLKSPYPDDLPIKWSVDCWTLRMQISLYRRQGVELPGTDDEHEKNI